MGSHVLRARPPDRQQGEACQCSGATRFQAVDARHGETWEPSRVRPSYSLADQLFVDPHPFLEECLDAESWPVEMTDQEIAVALSHIAVWERIAAGDSDYSLVLEDDTYFRRGFCRDLDKAWSDLVWNRAERPAFDLLYVSYKEVRTGKRFVPISGHCSNRSAACGNCPDTSSRDGVPGSCWRHYPSAVRSTRGSIVVSKRCRSSPRAARSFSNDQIVHRRTSTQYFPCSRKWAS